MLSTVFALRSDNALIAVYLQDNYELAIEINGTEILMRE